MERPHCLVRFIVNEKNNNNILQIKALTKSEYEKMSQHALSEERTPFDWRPCVIKRFDGRTKQVKRSDISFDVISFDHNVCSKYKELEPHIKYKYDYDIFSTVMNLLTKREVWRLAMARL